MNTSIFLSKLMEIKDERDVSIFLRDTNLVTAFAKHSEYSRDIKDAFEKLDEKAQESVMVGLTQLLPLSWELFSSFFKLLHNDEATKKYVQDSIWAVADTISLSVGEEFFEANMQEQEAHLSNLVDKIEKLDDKSLKIAIKIAEDKKTKKDKEQKYKEDEQSLQKLKDDIALVEKNSISLSESKEKLEEEIEQLKYKEVDLASEEETLKKELESLTPRVKTQKDNISKLKKNHNKKKAELEKFIEEKLSLEKDMEKIDKIKTDFKSKKDFFHELEDKIKKIYDEGLEKSIARVSVTLGKIEKEIETKCDLKDRAKSIIKNEIGKSK